MKKPTSPPASLPNNRRGHLNNICVIGLGRIGLPFALLAAKKGFSVCGVDTNAKIVNALKNGRIPFREPGLSQLIISNRSRLKPTTSLPEAIKQSSVVLCCVGTRRYATNRPNLKLLYKIFRDLARTEIRGRLIVLRTTVPIGTTRALAGYLEELTGLRADVDFYLAFAPERTVEGRAVEELETLPVIVGAMGEESLRRATGFYDRMGAEVAKVVNPEAAELVKLIDNTFRITRFAFANDIAFVSERIGVNAHDVIDAANFRYPRNSIPYPSCGVSGYCLSKDPYYLEEAFRPIRAERHFCSIWMNARKSYDFRSRQLVGQILRFLEKMGRTAKDARVLVCGVAFKSNVDDTRGSHGLFIASEFARKGAKVSVWDPCITGELKGYLLHKDPYDAFREKDVAIFTIAHDQFVQVANGIERFTRLMRTPLIYDGAGLLRARSPSTSTFYLMGTGFPSYRFAGVSRT